MATPRGWEGWSIDPRIFPLLGYCALGVNFSTNICLGSTAPFSDFVACPKKTKTTLTPAASLVSTAGNAESGGPRGWGPVIMTFTEEVKSVESEKISRCPANQFKGCKEQRKGLETRQKEHHE